MHVVKCPALNGNLGLIHFLGVQHSCIGLTLGRANRYQFGVDCCKVAVRLQLTSLQWQSQLALKASFLTAGAEGREGEVGYLFSQCCCVLTTFVRDSCGLLCQPQKVFLLLHLTYDGSTWTHPSCFIVAT